jgi:hypothetical protein
MAAVPESQRTELSGLPADALADIDTAADARRFGIELHQ